MRENRTCGSEGGAVSKGTVPTPYLCDAPLRSGRRAARSETRRLQNYRCPL